MQGGFIVGFDNDKPSILQRQIDFIRSSGIVTAMLGLLQAPPDTRLYDRLKQEDRLRHRLSGDNVDGTMNVLPKMNLNALREGCQRILQSIYSPNQYYQRINAFLCDCKTPKIKAPANFGHVLAFLRSVYELGIAGKDRLHYWRPLLWTLFRRPQLFPLTITPAIYGHHLRKICELRVL